MSSKRPVFSTILDSRRSPESVPGLLERESDEADLKVNNVSKRMARGLSWPRTHGFFLAFSYGHLERYGGQRKTARMSLVM